MINDLLTYSYYSKIKDRGDGGKGRDLGNSLEVYEDREYSINFVCVCMHVCTHTCVCMYVYTHVCVWLERQGHQGKLYEEGGTRAVPLLGIVSSHVPPGQVCDMLPIPHPLSPLGQVMCDMLQ